MRKQKGFSLIELLIVVAIILIIAAIAIPNLLRSKAAANESSAAASIRTLNSAQTSFETSFPTTGYAPNLVSLGGTCSSTAPPTSTGACLIDNVLSSGSKSGYTFNSAGQTQQTINGNAIYVDYLNTADPQKLNTTGVKGFCATEDGVIRYNTPWTATPSYSTCLTYQTLQ